MSNKTISELSSKTISELLSADLVESSDYLLISEQTTDKIFTSKKVNLSSMFNDVNEYLTEIPNINLNGEWKFDVGNIYINTNIINTAIKKDETKQIINIEYAYENFIDELDSLAKSLYRNRIIPSYVGEIIYSTTLKNERQVQQRYGKHTSWKQISGRFIIGVSLNMESKLSADVAGGEVNHTLTIEEIPAHSHKINPSTEKKKIETKFSATPDDTGQNIGVKSDKQLKTDNIGLYTNTLMGCAISTNKADAEVKNDIEIYGNKGANADIAENRSPKKNHNNIPPFFSLYIWERIK